MWYSAQTVLFAQSSLKQQDSKHFGSEEIRFMLWTILVVLLLLWLVGFYGGFVTNSLIHLLLVAAVIVLALNLFRRRNPA
jgi:Flp pilus assembly protein TadB